MSRLEQTSGKKVIEEGDLKEDLPNVSDELLFGSLEDAYNNDRYSVEHRAYIKKKIEDGLVSGEVVEKDRKEMFENYKHLIEYLGEVPKTDNIVDVLFDYFKNSVDEAGKPLYFFANLKLTEKDGKIPDGLGEHLHGVNKEANDFLFKKNKDYRFKDKGILSERNASLLAEVISPLHDVLKFLGTMPAQVMPDHEIMTAELVRTMFLGRKVFILGEEKSLEEKDVKFIASVIEDHENIGESGYLREQGRDRFIKSEEEADKAKAFFFLFDTQTGVFEIDDNNEVSFNEEQLEKRFYDLYFRHVARFIYNEETGEVEKKAKIFRPEWGAYALKDYIALFDELEKKGDLKMPEGWREHLIDTALKVLEEAETEHYEIVAAGKAKDLESGDEYDFSGEDILRIRETKLQLVNLLIQDDKYKPMRDALERVSERDGLIDPGLKSLIEKNLINILKRADIFSGLEDQEIKQRELAVKIIARPFDFKLDYLMHQREFLDKAASTASRGYNERHNYPVAESLTLQERNFNLSSFISLQETIGILGEKTQESSEEIIVGILEGTITYKKWLMLVEAQKMTYLGGRLWNGEVFYRKSELFDNSPVDHKREDWAQVVDNAKLMADWLEIDYQEDEGDVSEFITRETYLTRENSGFLEMVERLLADPGFMIELSSTSLSTGEKEMIYDIANSVAHLFAQNESRKEANKIFNDKSNLEKNALDLLASSNAEMYACFLAAIQIANSEEVDPVDVLKEFAFLDINIEKSVDGYLWTREVLLYRHLMNYKDKIWQGKEMEIGINPSGFSSISIGYKIEEVAKIAKTAEKILIYLGEL